MNARPRGHHRGRGAPRRDSCVMQTAKARLARNGMLMNPNTEIIKQNLYLAQTPRLCSLRVSVRFRRRFAVGVVWRFQLLALGIGELAG